MNTGTTSLHHRKTEIEVEGYINESQDRFEGNLHQTKPLLLYFAIEQEVCDRDSKEIYTDRILFDEMFMGSIKTCCTVTVTVLYKVMRLDFP